MMPPDSMRVARLAGILFALLAGLSSRTEADVLGRLVAAVDEQAGGTAPPPQSPDLTSWAGQARATGLPELLQFAVRQSPALQSARIDIAVAEARIEQTWARNDWLIAAELKGSRATTRNQGTTNSFGASVDVSRFLPTGGTIGLHADSTYARTTGSFSGLLDGTAWTDNVGLAITQPLLRGRGRMLFEANEVRATLARDVAVLARRLTAIQAVQAVISAYWDLVLAEQTVAITQQSLDLAKERLRVTRIGAEGGKVPRSEIPAVLQVIATREEDVLNGELSVLDRSIALRRAAGMPIGAGELGLRVTTELDAKDQPLDLAQLVERAFAASPELAELAKQDTSATIDIAVTENGLLPQLDAALSLGPTGTAEKFVDSWKELAKLNDLGISGTLTFSQSLGQHDVRGRAREQRELRRKLAVNAVDIRAQIAQTMVHLGVELKVVSKATLADAFRESLRRTGRTVSRVDQAKIAARIAG